MPTSTAPAALIDAIPDPADIRRRLEELRREGRVLRELLRAAEQRQRMSDSHKSEKGRGRRALDS